MDPSHDTETTASLEPTRDGDGALAGCEPRPPTLKRLVVGSADDPAEREADKRAGEVMRRLARSSRPPISDANPRVRRAPAPATRHGPADRALASPAPHQIIRRAFDPATVHSATQLRDDEDWGHGRGPKIPKGTRLLVNDHSVKTQERRFRNPLTWVPAVNHEPDDVGGPVAADRRGYVEATHVAKDGTSLNNMYRNLLSRILRDAEQLWQGEMDGMLDRPEVVEFLFVKALTMDRWNAAAASTDTFTTGFEKVRDKIGRVREGADFVADSLHHWRRWLHDDDRTTIEEVDFKESDLHEHGLGVLQVTFHKSIGPPGHKFADDRVVKVMIKPENKELEQALLGSEPGSVAGRVNDIAGLRGKDERLTTIRMESTDAYGSLVEVVKGVRADKMPAGPHPTKAIFHETLVFALLAGLDDLHGENIFWHKGRPYLVDADNVLVKNQMLLADSGDSNQKGFELFNAAETTKNRAELQNLDNTNLQSKILDAMLTKAAKRIEIAEVLRKALRNKRGRVVPIITSQWNKQMRMYNDYPTMRDYNLNYVSAPKFMVRDKIAYDSDEGPGLAGVVGTNLANPLYDADAEREQTERDFSAGTVPFYVYHFDSGEVRHNGALIYRGVDANQAIGEMLDRFDPTGASRQAAKL